MRILADLNNLAHFSERSARSAGIRADLANLSHFRRDRDDLAHFSVRSVRWGGVPTDLTDFPATSVRSMGIPTGVTYLADFPLRRWKFSPISPSAPSFQLNRRVRREFSPILTDRAVLTLRTDLR